MQKKLSKKIDFNTVFIRICVITTGAVLALYCVSLLLPLVWMLYSSFKGEIDYTLHPFAFPEVWKPGNYIAVLDKMKFPINTDRGLVSYNLFDLAGHSILLSGCASLLLILCQTCVAYLVSRYKFVGSRFIYALGIVVMIIPIVGNLPSAMVINKALGIYDNLFMYILVSPSNIFGLHFLLLYSAFKRLPWALAEAAFIDGANDYQVMFRIMVPMMLPTCAALFVLTFLGSWNDYMTPLIWLPSYPTLAYGMYLFQYNATVYNATMPQVLAGFTIVMIPTVLIYASSQKLIMSKFTVGGLKG